MITGVKIYNNEDLPWVEKYRPSRIVDVEQNDEIKNLLCNCAKSRTMPHFLFYGPPGTGKTSAILAMGRELFKEYYKDHVYEFNASDSRGISAVRGTITTISKLSVTERKSVSGDIIPGFKIIILDESDSMTDEAQDALRVIIEETCSTTRFCFICNYINKMNDAIKSRCSPVEFHRINSENMGKHIRKIAIKENIDLPDDKLDDIVRISNGDMRHAIMTLQNYKYIFDYQTFIKSDFNRLTLDEKEVYRRLLIGDKKDKSIDVYSMDGIISDKAANEILSELVSKKMKVIDLIAKAKKLTGMGFPVDNILLQIHGSINSTTNISDSKKALIFIESGEIMYRLKECANGYLQLLDYLVMVTKIVHDSNV